MKKGDDLDPKGLIYESYRIEGITPEECRSIFMDWALGTPLDADNAALIRQLLDRYAQANPDHPMTKVLEEGLTGTSKGRRGGRAARMSRRMN